MLRIYPILLFILIFSFAVSAQTPSPTPAPVYKAYIDAMAAGKSAVEKKAFPAAEAAYDQAVGLASNDDQRYDALIKRGAALEKVTRSVRTGTGKYGGATKTVVLFPDAVAAYRKAADLPGITVEKKAEAMMLIGDIYSSTYKSEYLPKSPSGGKGWKETARDEFTKIINLAGISGNTKARALNARANTYSTNRMFGRFDDQQVKASAKDLEAAILTEKASDKIKADALKDLALLAKRIDDVNTYFGAFDKITKLTGAEPEQRIDAYDALAGLYIDNGKFVEARKAANDGLAVAKAPQSARSSLYRDLAVVQLVDPANKTADGQKALKLTDAELDKAVRGHDLSRVDRIKILISFGEFFQQLKVVGATETAVAQYQKVLALKGISAKESAEAQYGIGEAYRLAGKKAEAIAAYEKVSSENGQYHNYARQRIKEVNAPAKATN